jgi:hypothetical protein
VQQGLEQLGRNLSEAGQETGAVSREVGAALNRAHTSMQQTQGALERAQEAPQLPAEQAGQTVDALNRLALSLLQNAQQLQGEAGSGLSRPGSSWRTRPAAGSISGQSNALLSPARHLGRSGLGAAPGA